jgi:CelD/BcsL family acetyltransferase involved in cellulose biosynthesis
LSQSSADCLFLTWEWLFTWWKHLARETTPMIVCARRGGPRGALSAIAPMVRQSPSWRQFRPIAGLAFLGTGSIGSDYLDLIARQGEEPESIEAVSRELTAERLMIDWSQLNGNSSLAAGAAPVFRKNGWTVSEATTNVCPFISLSGFSWDSYLQSLGVEHRYSFRRKLRKLTGQFEFTFEQARTEDEVREGIEEVINLHNQRWSDRGGSDAFYSPALISFHREMSGMAFNQGWLRLFLLRLNGEIAAGVYGFLYRKKFYYYQAGFNPRYSQYGIGVLAVGLAIKSAIEEGAREFDFLHGDESYKTHWTEHRRPVGRLQIFPPGFSGIVNRTSLNFGKRLKQVARYVLPGTFVDRLRANNNGSGPAS